MDEEDARSFFQYGNGDREKKERIGEIQKTLRLKGIHNENGGRIDPNQLKQNPCDNGDNTQENQQFRNGLHEGFLLRNILRRRNANTTIFIIITLKLARLSV